jgi:hypothetical protein
MQYDDYPEFNNYIDNLYGDSNGNITIEEFSRPASIVLFTMDEEAYLSSYNQYISQQKEKLVNETVFSSFPTPIAFFYDRALHGYDNNNQRLHFLRSTWEAIIFFLYALVIGEVVDSSRSISPVRIFTRQPVKCDKSGLLSDKLGYKLEFIEKILDFNNSSGNHSLIDRKLIPPSVVDSLKDLTKARNSFSHISALSEEQSRTLFEQLHPKIQDILFELKNLESLSLLRFKASTNVITRIKFSKFKGYSLKDRNYEKNVDSTFITKNVANLRHEYLFCEFEESDQIICLSPFACTMQHNGQPHIAWYKKLDVATNEYSFEIVSDSPVELNLDSNTFDKPIQALGALL